uniref:Helicase ATP-binding domain-containing protein n=1 Tax=Heterorhabditis bacteriophora TaxID=37862 RepID=A0A1I7XSL1_HETBA
MSSCKFGDEGKSRVAHRATPVSTELLQSLEHKRLALAKVCLFNVLNCSNNIILKFGLNGRIFYRPVAKSIEFRPISRETPILKIKIAGQDTITAKGKEKTLSDSSEEEQWLCKPRFNGTVKAPMKTRVSDSPIKKYPRKKIILSDESEDEAENAPSASTLKKVAKSAAKHARKNKGVSSDEDEWDDDCAAENDGSNHSENTPSDDSDAEERRSHRRCEKEDDVSRKCREFFNAATQAQLLATPRVTEKIALCIINKRPFESFMKLETAISEVARGKQALEAYMEHLENRDVLEKILDDCKDHADAVAQDFEQCTQNKFQPSLLTNGCNLHEYQQIGLNWLIMMYKKGFNCILGDEMGLGKTIQVIAFLAYLKEKNVRGPHLVVVPSSTVENWMGEITKWCQHIKLLTYYGSQEERKQLRHMAKKKKETIDVVLTTYNMISSKHDDKKFFKNFSMNYVIYDEGHMLKNCGTERYRNLMKVKNGPALEAGSAAMYQKDRIEQAKLILQPYILRRLKVQVLGHLPEKLEEVIEVDMLDKQRDNYEKVLDSVRGDDGDPNNAYGALVKLRQAANHPLLRRIQFNDVLVDKLAKTLCAKILTKLYI